MNYKTKIQLLAAVFTIILISEDVTALKCKGTPSMLQGYAAMCLTESSSANFDHSQSCVSAAIADARSCSTSDKCTEINIKIVEGQFANTNNMIWSVSGCYDEEMDIFICADDVTVSRTTLPATTEPSSTATPPPTETSTAASTTDLTTTEAVASSASPPLAAIVTTTDVPSTTMAAAPVASTLSMASASTTDTETTTDSPSSSAEPTMSTTSADLTSTQDMVTLSAPELDDFTTCFTATARFPSATCAADSLTVVGNLLGSTNMTHVIGMVTLTVQAIECCDNEDNCRVDDGQTRDNSCYFGTDTDLTEVMCASDCFSYVHNPQSSSATIQHGCLTDIDLSGTSFSGATECTSTYETGSCSDAGSEQECLKCCTSENCNDYRKSDFDYEKEDNSAGSIASSMLLFMSALLLSKFY